MPEIELSPREDIDARIEWAESLQIKELVGEFTTNYVAGQSRVVNIQRIAELTRGAIIEPGGEFSINDYVGRRTRANGFVDAGVIVNGVFNTWSAVGSASTQPPSSTPRSSQASTLVSTSRTRSTSIGTRTVEKQRSRSPTPTSRSSTTPPTASFHGRRRPTHQSLSSSSRPSGSRPNRPASPNGVRASRARVSPPNAPAPGSKT